MELPASASALYLLITSGLAVLVFIPMALWPLGWARVAGWPAAVPSNLATYYGRCLGCVSSVLGAAGVYASFHPALLGFFFAVSLACFSLMVLLHAYGTLRRIQPASESWETLLWLFLCALTIGFWPR
jgi:hypothetical protein